MEQLFFLKNNFLILYFDGVPLWKFSFIFQYLQLSFKKKMSKGLYFQRVQDLFNKFDILMLLQSYKFRYSISALLAPRWWKVQTDFLDGKVGAQKEVQ